MVRSFGIERQEENEEDKEERKMKKIQRDKQRSTVVRKKDIELKQKKKKELK